MSEAVRVRTSRMSPTAALLMVVLGVIAFLEVSGILGIALVVLGVAMYLFDRRVNSRRNRRRDRGTPAAGR